MLLQHYSEHGQATNSCYHQPTQGEHKFYYLTLANQFRKWFKIEKKSLCDSFDELALQELALLELALLEPALLEPALLELALLELAWGWHC